MASTNALTARYCRSKGWPCDTVQQWRGSKRADLFGVIDSVVAHEKGILFIQNCSYGSLSEHRQKVEFSWFCEYMDEQGLWFELWEWRRKKAGRRLMWFRRSQKRANAAWGEVSPWEGPLDIYPPKERNEHLRQEQA